MIEVGSVVVGVAKGMCFGGDKGMVESMAVDKQEEMLQQRPQQQQQQPQLPGAAAPNPWPPPLSAENERMHGVSADGCPKTGWHCRLDGGCGDVEDLVSPSVA